MSILGEILQVLMTAVVFVTAPCVNFITGLFPAQAPPLRLGAYYWDGWCIRQPQWTDRLLGEFADREPTWGWLSAGVENMEMQIDLAADNGLSFFAFDWCYAKNEDESLQDFYNALNCAVDAFLLAGNNDRMEFCLMVCNGNQLALTEASWPDATACFMPYLTSDRALKVDGKPVIIFHSAQDASIESMDGMRRGVAYLRAQCAQAGLPGCYVIVCNTAGRDKAGEVPALTFNWALRAVQNGFIGFDAVTGYNYNRGTNPPQEGVFEYPFQRLSADYEKVWKMQARYCGQVKYMPVLNGGWDSRPWEGDGPWPNDLPPHCYSPDRTPEDFYNHVKNAAQWVNDNPRVSAGGLAVFYAWNEMGEGGYILPTKGEGDAVLKAIREAVDSR